jgi:hypothetical protein
MQCSSNAAMQSHLNCHWDTCLIFSAEIADRDSAAEIKRMISVA